MKLTKGGNSILYWFTIKGKQNIILHEIDSKTLGWKKIENHFN